MARKMYDIKPPKMAKKAEKEIKEFLAGSAKPKTRKKTQAASVVREPVHEPAHRHKKETKFSWLPVSIGVVAMILIVAVYLFFKLPKADITIWPKIETLEYKQMIIADKSVAVMDLAKGIIPAKYFQTTKTNSQDFPATGNASNEGQASGTITIYNKYTPATPFTFKAGTHFMSDSGKLFVAMQKIVVPAAKKVGSKLVPGSVQVSIKAVEGGTSYNIAPSNFSIPGLKGTAYYYSIYATSTEAMSGGYQGDVKKVTDDDIQSAKDVLTKKTTADAMADLKSQISSDYVLLDNAVLTETTVASTKTKAGAIADTFNYQATVQASAMAFKKSDLDDFAKKYIVSKAGAGKAVLDSSYKMDYSASMVDVSGGKITLNTDFSSGVYQSVDKNSLSLSLLGENSNQVTQSVNNALPDAVSKMKISFWPFWVKSVPNNQNAVKIEVKFQ